METLEMVQTPNKIHHRRRGNVMLFVIFILGALFAASVAFLSLTRKDAKVLTAVAAERNFDNVLDSLVDRVMVTSVHGVFGENSDRIPYLQSKPAFGQIADDADWLSQYAEIPGVHSWLASIEPYDPGTGVLEWYAVTDLSRAWDGQADVHPYDDGSVISTTPDIQPTVPASRPLRIRALDEGVSGPLGPYTNPYDATVEDLEGHGFRRDADGDGVLDAIEFRIALLGRGEPDWYPALGPTGPDDYVFGDTNDTDCNGKIDPGGSPYIGPPSFTGGPPTPLPCDDQDGDNILNLGTAIPQELRRGLAGRMRDEDTAIGDPDDDLYLALRVIQNGGMVNINSSHWTLVDNLFGLNSQMLVMNRRPVAEKLQSLPYTPESTEPLLRRRGFLPARNLPDESLGLGRDIQRDLAPASFSGDLSRVLVGHMTSSAFANNPLQWFALAYEPGQQAPTGQRPFDSDWAGRWMNPFMWNDPADSARIGNIRYDIRHLITTVSTDDLLMRNGWYDYDGVSSGDPPVRLTDLLILDPGRFNIPSAYPAYSPQSPTEIFYVGQADDSALGLYPGYDPTFDVITMTGDRSFLEIDPVAMTVRPKVTVPLRVGGQRGPGNTYGPVRDSNGKPLDHRFGRMQFSLHSIGNINAPTQREIQTVLDYFTVLMRNVWDLGPTGADRLAKSGDEWWVGSDATACTWDDLEKGIDNIPCSGDEDFEQPIHDQAAQLTANFFDFADFDSGAMPGADPFDPTGLVPGGQWDYPTEVASRTGTLFYGVENQPFISEVYQDGSVWAVEFFNPHDTEIPDLTGLGYKLRIKETEVVHSPLIAFGSPITIPPGGYYYYASDPDADELGDPPPDTGTTTMPPLTFNVGETIQLIRQFPPGTYGATQFIVVDEFKADDPGVPGNSLQRDTVHSGGWLAPVPVEEAPGSYEGMPTFGNTNVVDLVGVMAPVHATTDSMGLESAYPTTGSMLLLMRYAHELPVDKSAFPPKPNDANAKPMSKKLAEGDMYALDNGHMPVFDTLQLAQMEWLGKAGAQPMDGTTQLAVPWGQLVFDYFTALPLSNRFDPMLGPPEFTIPVSPGTAPDPDWPSNPNGDANGNGILARNERGYDGYVAYLRANQPTVEWGGLRVHGRININAAPWKVLQGLPLMPPTVLPIYKTNPTYDIITDFGLPISYTMFGGPLAWVNLVDPDMGAPVDMPMGEQAYTMLPPPSTIRSFEQLGQEKAMGIVAYRELREIVDPYGSSPSWQTGSYNVLNWRSRLRWHDWDPNNTPLVLDDDDILAKTNQRHTAGFLTVGELLNVRNRGTFNNITSLPGAYEMDNGQRFGPQEGVGPGTRSKPYYNNNKNYLFAVAPIVALGDWVTVKGHTFTAYGVLRGHGKKDEVDKRAVRFEMTYDRSNVLVSDSPSERPTVIYRRQEPYQELSEN